MKWHQLTESQQEAAAALVEAHLRMSSGKQKQRSMWKFGAAKALRKRSGDSGVVDIAAVWDNEDLSFTDVPWAELQGRADLQQLAHHLPAYDGLSWDQLEIHKHLRMMGWTERAWDSAATVARCACYSAACIA